MKGFLTYLRDTYLSSMNTAKHSKHTTSWVIIILMLAVSVTGVKYSQLGLQTSVLTLEQPKDFDGTVYPLPKVPKWHALSSDEYTLSYDEIPEDKMQEMPRYNPNTLQASLSDIGYSDEENIVRDAKVTYSVAYLGNYKLDGVEYAGSHPAIDIKAPSGTPVVSIANGVVTKVSDQAYGFGLHVVVKHVNVPTQDGGTQTLYSSYSHLHAIDVKEGQVVAKGDRVGTVGDTGTATVEHLHFQLDKGGSDTDPDIEAAPWHPYWPFTYSDYASQGLTFFDAINQGIGQENAIKYTMNPMTFVQSHLVELSSLDQEVEEVVEKPVEEETEILKEAPEKEVEESIEEIISDSVEEELVEEAPIQVEPVKEAPVIAIEDTEEVLQVDEERIEIAEVPETDTVPTKPEYNLEFSGKDTYLVGNLAEFELTIKDMNGDIVNDPFFAGSMILSSTDSDLVEFEDDTLDREDFVDGRTLVKVRLVKDGTFKLRLPFGDTIYESDLVTVREDVKELKGFALEHDGYFAVDESEEVTIVPIDDDGNRTAFTILGEVQLEVVKGDALLDQGVLTMEDFSEGVATVRVIPTSEEDLVLRAQHSFIKGTSEPLVSGAPLFSDLSEDHENYDAIYKLKKRGVISGYPDGTFKPYKGVSRVEALKLIFAGLEAVVPDPEMLRFTMRDLLTDQWYAPYVAYAINEGVVKGYPDGLFRPEQTVNKAEFSKMLVLGLSIDINLDVEPDAPLIGQDVRPGDWFYPYVRFLFENEIIDLVDNKFNPSEPMDRAKVAEAIWRIIKNQ